MNQQLIQKKAVYEEPKLTVASFDDVDILTSSGGEDVQNGVGVKWNWQNFDDSWK